jgi:HD superfamily phosphodiesterase
MSYFSEYYQVDVRESIAEEFTNSGGGVDDMMAGLHEIRVRMAEKEYDLKELQAKLERNEAQFRITRRRRCDNGTT